MILMLGISTSIVWRQNAIGNLYSAVYAVGSVLALWSKKRPLRLVVSTVGFGGRSQVSPHSDSTTFGVGEILFTRKPPLCRLFNTPCGGQNTLPSLRSVLGLVCYHRISRAVGPEACGRHAAWTLCIEAWKTAGLKYAVGVNAIGFVVWLANWALLFIPLFGNDKGWQQIGFPILQVVVAGLLGVHVYTVGITQDNMTKQSDWSFGQVIAVTIWLPVIAEFGYNILKHWWVSQGHVMLAANINESSTANSTKSESTTAEDTMEAKDAANHNADLEAQTQ